MTAPSPHDVTHHEWDRVPERGSARLVGLMIWLSLTLGWHVGYALLFPITLYFFVCARGARENSRVFLVRALGRRPGWRDIYRQYFAFAAVILDRVYLLADRAEKYDVRLVGLHHLTTQLQTGGCLLFGAHVGSFEILRAIAPRDRPFTIKALMHRAAATPLTGPLERINPALRDDIIEIGTIDAMLRVRDALASGAIVGVLADRAPEGPGRRNDKRSRVDFFGHPAEFPTGPMLMAAALGAPVVLFFGIWTGPRRYEVHFEPFADRIHLGADRPADLHRWTARYAARLEARCRASPYNWFNLYNFWKTLPDAAPDPARVVAVGGDGSRPASPIHGGGADAPARRGAAEPCGVSGGKDHRPVDHAGA